MTIYPIASQKHHPHKRPSTRVTLFAAGLFSVLTLAVIPFVHPATARAFDSDYYDWCKNNLTQSQGKNGLEFCCSKAGGELLNGGCYDPAVLHPPITAVPTVTQQVLPPVIVQPAP